MAHLQTLRIARQADEWDGTKPIILERDLDYHFLDAADRALVAAVARYFEGQSSSQVSDFSHENPGWVLAWSEFKRLGRPTPINMRIALQQIVSGDPWMEDPLIDDEEALSAAGSGDGIDW